MIKGKHAVLQFFDILNSANDHSYIYFSVYKKGNVEKGNAAFSTPPAKEGWNYEQSRDLLSNWLNLQQFGEFTIMVNDDQKASARGCKRQDFTIEGESLAPAAVSGPQYSAEDISAQVNTKVTEILERKERERELEELKKRNLELERENKELEKSANDPWTRFISGLDPYIPNILEGMGIIKTKVAGPQAMAQPVATSHTAPAVSDSPEEMSEQDMIIQQRSEAAMLKIITARPTDWLELLEKIAIALERDPGLADKVKMFL